MQRFSISLFVLIFLSFGIHAQSDIPSIIALRDGEYSIFNADGTQTPLGTGVIVFDTYGQTFIYGRDGLHYFDGQKGQLISDDFSSICPPQFSEDGSSVIYLSSNKNPDVQNTGYSEHLVFRKPITSDSPAILWGTIRMDIAGGGGGGPFYLNDEVYWNDVSQYPGVPALFAATDYGTFYNVSCGYYGLLMASLSDPQPQYIADFQVWAISPDRTQIIGYDSVSETEGNLVRYDLASGTMEVIYAIPNLANRRSEMFFQLYWADENTIYYSTSQFSDTDYGLGQLEGNPGTIPPHTATIQISRFDLASRSAEIIYEQANSWAASRLTSDENYLYFSVVPDGTSLAEAYQAGNLALNDTESAQALIQPDIYRIPLAGGESEVLYEDVLKFFLLSTP